MSLRSLSLPRALALLAGALLLLVGGCSGSRHKSTTHVTTYSDLTIAMDKASCELQGTTLAIDEIDGVDITYHFQTINLSPGGSYTIHLRAPAKYRVQFTGYDASGIRTTKWDFETSLELDVPKTETISCPTSLPMPGQDLSAHVGMPVGKR